MLDVAIPAVLGVAKSSAAQGVATIPAGLSLGSVLGRPVGPRRAWLGLVR